MSNYSPLIGPQTVLFLLNRFAYMHYVRLNKTEARRSLGCKNTFFFFFGSVLAYLMFNFLPSIVLNFLLWKKKMQRKPFLHHVGAVAELHWKKEY